MQKKAEERWGAGVVEQVSLDLRREFPKEDGFSARNLRYMKQWYLYYTTEAAKLQRSIAEIVFQAGFEVHPVKLQRPVAELQEGILQRPVGELVKQPVQEQLKERMELLQKELRVTKRLMKKASE